MVIEGMGVVDEVAKVETGNRNYHCVPLEPVTIQGMTVVEYLRMAHLVSCQY